MVKAKQLKILRKKVERAEKILNPLEEVAAVVAAVKNGGGAGGGGSASSSLEKRSSTRTIAISFPTTAAAKSDGGAPQNDGGASGSDGDGDSTVGAGGDSSGKATAGSSGSGCETINAAAAPTTTPTRLSLEYVSSADMSDSLLESCMKLFEENMGELYKRSSWGLDLPAKADELRHRKARFLLAFADGEKDEDATTTNNKENGEERVRQGGELASFVHFRFCYDDEDEPEYAVLYVYEIHVDAKFQRKGVGARLMSVLESIAKAAGLEKVVLTVFKNNVAATEFYTNSLDYQVDESSPSRHGDKSADYEILSKAIS